MIVKSIMRDSYHERTLIAIIAAAIVEWKDSKGWSRETVADKIISHFYDLQPKGLPGISFNLNSSGDEYQRMHVNANKLFRWLDEITKDGTLPSNMCVYLLGALPVDLRTKTVNNLMALGGINMTAKPVLHADPDHPLEMLENVLTESAEATKALAALVDGVDPGELEHAQHTLSMAIAAMQSAKRVIDAQLMGASHVKS